MKLSEPSFNLWTEPWITLESPDSALTELGLAQTLLRAHEYLAIYDPSPLVIVGIHRLLTAILQDIVDPQRPSDLAKVWARGHISEAEVQAFGDRYAARFDLFSETVPFLQTADLPREAPSKRASGLKPVTYLMHQMPAGTAVAHYHHGVAEEQTFCPICAARGLLTIPAFATSGGAGIKPSINGVPPIYVLPGGTSLFESLVASLVLPDYQPSAASTTRDDVWWRREPVVERKATVHEVGYLHSLTFPARRVRLHPQSMHEPCSRCGRQAPWGVQSMIYRMGESRPKDAPFWFDPFAAYRLRGRKGPVPIRPREGKALWREFAALFLPSPLEEGKGTQPPSALYQRAELAAEADIGPSYAGLFPYRCVGMRTDMKAKIFEWIDANFEVPAALVNDIIGSDEIRQGLTFAEDCARLIGRTFRRTFGGEGQTEHHETLRHRLIDAYWAALADAFRDFVLHVATSDDRQQARVAWIDRVVAEGKRAFKEASEVVGDDADALRKRVTGRRICAAQLNKKRKEVLGEDIA